MKRLLDLFLASIGIALSLPLWVLFGLLIYLNNREQIFYIQERVGKDGRRFSSYQFRSMILRTEKISGPIQSAENDPRVTRIGRIMRGTALDELPQLINIVKNDMSFVGPRALRPEEREVGSNRVISVFEYSDFAERCKVKPGLTGIAQLLLPRDEPREIKFKYDLWYIKNQTFWLDIWLIFLSFLVTFQGRWETRSNKLGGLLNELKSRVDREIGLVKRS